jgi:hypothetical protein
MKNVNELNGERLVMGKNFLTVSNKNMEFYYEKIEEILLVAKMSGYDFFFSSNRGNKSFVMGGVKEFLPEKAHDMINIKYPHNNQTVFYLTLTYGQKEKNFVEFGLNPMTEKTQKIIVDFDELRVVRHSKYFYATNNFDDITKILSAAMEIVKKI